ncbi:Pantothenate synthetase [Thiorhodococcus drewsii AZ1]|uniref:Pantothenate synthetase n=1 Tax=Thiorhodococcus drewsii AZ1 TaxID=765913 RepID=G2DXI6_9GAMM|nr:pantoate--beta-alanine ligase [Thiorhodococcus drewsii]EGV33035.1 Pantothenate synthetase [Thiorhodococcus drewsii AZ1]
MESVELLQDLRRRVAAWRLAGQRLALVPTMGNLHRGHISLIEEARRRADRVVASIFVNPLQFGPSEDLGAYPRTLEEDRRRLDEAGCDLLFTPGVQVMYPHGQESHTRVEVPGLSAILCGATRPGHFVGVTTVVSKLFNMVQPDVALFGEKDFQQLVVIRRMVADLNMPIEIVGVPIARESDGLAMSSRNGYLTAEERALAPGLHRALLAVESRLAAGADIAEVEAATTGMIREAGLGPDYVSIRSAIDLEPATEQDEDLVVLAAAYLGRARLIDNLRIRRIGD